MPLELSQEEERRILEGREREGAQDALRHRQSRFRLAVDNARQAALMVTLGDLNAFIGDPQTDDEMSRWAVDELLGLDELPAETKKAAANFPELQAFLTRSGDEQLRRDRREATKERERMESDPDNDPTWDRSDINR